MSTTLVLIRHCQTTGQAADDPLTADGHAAAVVLAERLAGAGIRRIVSSPYVRATQSAEPLARRLGLGIETDPRLRERVFTAEPRPDWRERLRESFLDDELCLPGGESSRTASARGVAVLEGLWQAAGPPTAVVTHGNLLSLLLRHLDGRDAFETWHRLTNPDVYRVDGPAAAPSVTRIWHDD